MEKISVFLDSGAFSAWTKKSVIDIQEYIQFIKENEEYLEVYANLDVIGDPKATLMNQETMEKAGLRPLPCYHFGENPKYLLHYLKGYDYIALGGMVGKSSQDLCRWLDMIFSDYICDSDGMPKVKIHGFGLTSLKLMLRYPWFSVDSTSWVITGRMGSVLVPRFKDGKYIYDEGSWKVSVSSRSPDKKEAGQHIDTFPPLQKKAIMEYIRDKGYILGKSSFKSESAQYELQKYERWFGKEVDGKREVEIIEKPGLCNDYKQRDEMNIIYYLDLEKHFKSYPWAFQSREIRSGFDEI